jgi:RecA/RadA recombinase
MPKTKRGKSLADQVKTKAKEPISDKTKKFEGNTETMISTGSLLLDLATSGGRVYGGGIPGGISVVAYGPSGTGKTVLACEVAGDIIRKGGAVNYKDSEARLNPDFAEIFDLEMDDIEYSKPNTIAETFNPLYEWKPNPDSINGYIIDSLAALSTDMEMEGEDKMGMRRAKEFSTHYRKCARVITNNNTLLFATNQIRENADAGLYQRKDVNPGGKAIEFYASLIYRFRSSKPIKKEVKIAGKSEKRVVGIEVTIEVDKSSVWKPHRTADVIIYFDYGIDDIRANLMYVKKYTSNTTYKVKDVNLGNSLDAAVLKVEEQGLEGKLRKQVIKLWTEIESKFEIERKKKKR